MIATVISNKWNCKTIVLLLQNVSFYVQYYSTVHVHVHVHVQYYSTVYVHVQYYSAVYVHVHVHVHAKPVWLFIF